MGTQGSQMSDHPDKWKPWAPHSKVCQLSKYRDEWAAPLAVMANRNIVDGGMTIRKKFDIQQPRGEVSNCQKVTLTNGNRGRPIRKCARRQNVRVSGLPPLTVVTNGNIFDAGMTICKSFDVQQPTGEVSNCQIVSIVSCPICQNCSWHFRAGRPPVAALLTLTIGKRFAKLWKIVAQAPWVQSGRGPGTQDRVPAHGLGESSKVSENFPVRCACSWGLLVITGASSRITPR